MVVRGTVLGLAGLVAPDGVEVARSVIMFDLPVMIAVAVACLPLFFHGGEISRWKVSSDQEISPFAPGRGASGRGARRSSRPMLRSRKWTAL